MNDEEKEELITFSEAARLIGTSPQNISDLVKRNRLTPEIIGEKRFLRKLDVVSLTKGKSGRPQKTPEEKYSKFFQEMQEACERFHKSDEERYPKSLHNWFQIRKYLFVDTENKESESSILSNSIWRNNKKKLRRYLKIHEMSWQPIVTFGEVILTRKYVNPVIEQFFQYCIESEKMLEAEMSVEYLKHKYLLYCEQIFEIDSSKDEVTKKEKKIIVSIFKEFVKSESNSLLGSYKVIVLLLNDKNILSGLTKVEKICKAPKIIPI